MDGRFEQAKKQDPGEKTSASCRLTDLITLMDIGYRGNMGMPQLFNTGLLATVAFKINLLLG